MLVHPWQSSVSLADALMDLRQPRQTECVPCPEDDMVNIVQLGTVLECDLPCQRIKAADLLLHGDMGVLKGCPTECRDRFAAYGCIHWMLGLWQDLVEYLVRGD